MKKLSLVFTIIIASVSVYSQSDSLQIEINQQVWKPFIQSFNERDDKTFRSVHSKDLIRVSQDQNKVSGLDEYIPDPSLSSKKNNSSPRKIELRFLQRIASDGRAFETGYYKTTVTNTTTGKSNSFYGKFRVLLRKENAVWKILMDADAHENTSEVIFMNAKPME